MRRKPLLPERRQSPLRRQFNEAFCDPDGHFNLGKFLALWTQIVVLGHLGRTWDQLLDKPETLVVVLTFLIAPDVFKKFLTLKYGGVKA